MSRRLRSAGRRLLPSRFKKRNGSPSYEGLPSTSGAFGVPDWPQTPIGSAGDRTLVYGSSVPQYRDEDEGQEDEADCETCPLAVVGRASEPRALRGGGGVPSLTRLRRGKPHGFSHHARSPAPSMGAQSRADGAGLSSIHTGQRLQDCSDNPEHDWAGSRADQRGVDRLGSSPLTREHGGQSTTLLTGR